MTPIDTGSELFPEAWHDGDTVYCRLADDLNVQTVPWAKAVFNKLLVDHRPTKLIVDLRDVGFVDSSGLAALVVARKGLPADGAIVLRDTAGPVRGLLKIAQLDQLFTFEESTPAETG